MKMTMRFLTMSLLFLSMLACSKGSEPQQSAPTELAGKVLVSSALAEQIDSQAILYIIARKQAGPPLAVKRIARPQFPVTYQLTEQDIMMPGVVFQGEVVLKARLDKDGNAGPLQSGDMTGQLDGTVPVGTGDADITIDTLVP